MLIGIYILGAIIQTTICVFEIALDYEGYNIVECFCFGVLWPVVWLTAILRGMIVVIRRLILDVKDLWR